MPPGSGPPQRSRTSIVIITLTTVAVVAVVGVLIYAFAFKGGNASDNSPQDQIRALMKSTDDYLNNDNAEGLASLLCDAQKNSPSFHAHTGDQLRKQRDALGLETSSVTDIDVAGDHATARVNISWSKSPQYDLTETVEFVRENGGWKVCGPADKK